MHWKSGKIAEENTKAAVKQKFQYFKNRALAVFSKTFYPLRQLTEITFKDLV